jgi:regulator of cell morphogenesis and NO signaling
MTQLSFSPETTVGEIVAAQPAFARVFERLGIDYCCGGKRTLAQVFAAKGVDPVSAATLLTASIDAFGFRPVVDPARMSLTELADHIEHTHHAYLKDELPRMVEKADRVAEKHAWRDARLVDVAATVRELADEMFSHMAKEEQILFPIVRELERGNVAASDHCGSIANPIRVMEHEHDSAGNAIALLRKLTGGFRPDAESCNTHRALLSDLARFESDLHEHVHKENNVLFPRAVTLEQQSAA